MPVSTRGQYDIEAIKRRLPHRYPLLMVDRIEESGPRHAVGIKNVTANEPCFQGHFPERSILPGSMIAEALMQTSAFMGSPDGSRREDGATAEAGKDAADRRFFCAGMNLKFRKPVVPGDRLRLDVRFIRMLGDMVRIKVTAQTAAGIVASGDLNLAVVTEEDET